MPQKICYGLLGEVTLHQDGAPHQVPGQLPRTVLAMLLLNSNRAVGVSTMADVLWGERPPASAKASLYNIVLRLRRQLGPQAAHRLRSVTAGYLLEVREGELDLQAFTDLCRSGHKAQADQRWPAARSALASALELWRGEPLADVDRPALDQAERQHLEELRLRALQGRIHADLQLGLHATVVPELRALTHQHPLTEPFHGLLMLALYRSNRPGDALTAYQDLRTALAEALGADPSSALQQLHHDILKQSPVLDPPPDTITADLAARAPEPGRVEAQGSLPPCVASQVLAPATPLDPTPTDRPIPRQLPFSVQAFIGRTAALRELDTLMAPADGAASAVAPSPTPTAPPRIAVICGMAAIGKTALALHWARGVADRFPDGQLYVDLRGFDPSAHALAPAEALCGFLDALGIAAAQRPVGAQAQAALYRSLLADKRVLVVLDNACDEGQIRPLLPGGSGCAVVVTSRTWLTGLAAGEGAQIMALGRLGTAESWELLVRRVGRARVAAEHGAVRELIDSCAGLPLAVSIAAARAAAMPRHSLADLAAQLRDSRERLDALGTGDTATDLRSVFSWSLGRVPPRAALLFRLLGLHPGPHTTVAAAASLAALPLRDARSALDELVRAHLVDEAAPGLFVTHDLLRGYARELAESLDPEAVRHAATHRVLDHYLHTAHRALRTMPRPVSLLDLPAPPADVVLDLPATPQEACVWSETNQPVLVNAVFWAAEAGLDMHAWKLARCLAGFLEPDARWQAMVESQQTALRAAHRLADRFAQALTERTLGYAHGRMGDFAQALELFTSAVDTFRAIGGYQAGRARSHQGAAWVLGLLGRHPEAMAHAQQALDAIRDSPDLGDYANALNTVGRCHTYLGSHERALACCRQALAIHQQSGDRLGEAEASHSIGLAHQAVGEHTEALTAQRDALDLFEQLGDRHYIAETMAALADTHDALGAHVTATDLRCRALPVLQDIHHPDADRVKLLLTLSV